MDSWRWFNHPNLLSPCINKPLSNEYKLTDALVHIMCLFSLMAMRASLFCLTAQSLWLQHLVSLPFYSEPGWILDWRGAYLFLLVRATGRKPTHNLHIKKKMSISKGPTVPNVHSREIKKSIDKVNAVRTISYQSSAILTHNEGWSLGGESSSWTWRKLPS